MLRTLHYTGPNVTYGVRAVRWGIGEWGLNLGERATCIDDLRFEIDDPLNIAD